MLFAGTVVALLLATGAPEASNKHLSKGIQLYNDGDFAGALDALTQALDKSDTKPEEAKVRLYIGLIQVRFGLTRDARVSFGKAVEYDERIKLPKGSPKEAQRIFKQVKPKEPKAEKVEKPPKKPRKERPPKEVPPAVDPQPEAPLQGDPRPTDPTPPVDGAAEEPNRDPPVVAAVTPAVPPSIPPDPMRAPPPERMEPPPPDLTPTVRTSAEADEDSAPVGAIITGGVGVAAVATGVVMLFLAKSTNNEALNEPVALRAEELHQKAVSQQTIGFVSFGVGGAALIAAGVLLLVD